MDFNTVSVSHLYISNWTLNSLESLFMDFFQVSYVRLLFQLEIDFFLDASLFILKLHRILKYFFYCYNFFLLFRSFSVGAIKRLYFSSLNIPFHWNDSFMKIDFCALFVERFLRFRVCWTKFLWSWEICSKLFWWF